MAKEVGPMRPAPRSTDSGLLPAVSRADDGSVADLRAIGPYRLLRLLGSGGMSEVYLAHDDKHGRQVAVKVLADRLMTNQSYVNRFLNEGRLGRELSHPNIVRALDFGRDAGTGKYFIVMDFIDGPAAQERLEQDSRLSIAESVCVVIDIARGLEQMHHHRYVHRDIKPGNIIIGTDGVARLIDLGVAKKLDDNHQLTALDQGVGTPYYMPWEQGLNSNIVDGRSDIFALGATFYHLLTGQVPFPGDDEVTIARHKNEGTFLPVRAHNRQFPSVLDTILDRMLAKDPRKRFATALDVVEALSASGLAQGTHLTDLEMPIYTPQPLAPTRADLKLAGEVDTPLESASEQLWMVKFQKPGDSAWYKVRGRTPEIARLYVEGVLPDEVYAARNPSKIFRRLKAYPEFRALDRPLMTGIDDTRHNPLRRPRQQRQQSAWRPYLGTLFTAALAAGLLCLFAVGMSRLMAYLQSTDSSADTPATLIAPTDSHVDTVKTKPNATVGPNGH